MLEERNLGWWVEEVTYDAIKFLHAQGKIPGFFTKGADGQGIDFKTGMDFLIGLRNGLSMKLQVKYSEREKPFRLLVSHLKRYASARYILLFTNKLEDDFVTWKHKQKESKVKDSSGEAITEDRFDRHTPDGIFIALVRTDAKVHELFAREREKLNANKRFSELRVEHGRYQACRGKKSGQLPVGLWRHIAGLEDEMRAIVEAERAPFREDPHYRAFVKRVAAQLERFVEAACITALWYEKEQELRRQAKSENGMT